MSCRRGIIRRDVITRSCCRRGASALPSNYIIIKGTTHQVRREGEDYEWGGGGWGCVNHGLPEGTNDVSGGYNNFILRGWQVSCSPI